MKGLLKWELDKAQSCRSQSDDIRNCKETGCRVVICIKLA